MKLETKMNIPWYVHLEIIHMDNHMDKKNPDFCRDFIISISMAFYPENIFHSLQERMRY